MRKNKIILLLVFIGSFFLLSSCFKQERFTFREGNFLYSGEKVQFYDEIYLEEIVITFEEINETEYDESSYVNVLQNRKDNKFYKVLLSIQFYGMELEQFSFKDRGKPDDRVDCYCIDIEIDNDLFESSITVFTILEFSIGWEYQSSVESGDTGAYKIDLVFDKTDYELNAEYDLNGRNILLNRGTIVLHYQEEK